MALATLSSVKPIAIAQQGEQIYGRKFCFITNKKNNPKLCIQKCNTDPRVGTSNDPMGKANVDMDKVLVPKGIDLSSNQNTADPEKIHAIVTRSLSPEYRHAIILKSTFYTKRN
jgi:hypothetical protein